ncbi:MAG: hypothetical protein ACI8ZM_004928 [Crocinitomix sp.]|jgi:hypothetical protein
MLLRRYSKGIAIILLMTFGQELILPSALWALTGGPSQPEVNSFEPVGTNQMVDLTTGDFNYNIPLMVVPGPNGGYPINLAYHAGIGMEQEASWVGLGWNINPGAITRNLRGVPDDFSGDTIVQKMNLKSNITSGLTFDFGQLRGDRKETFGIERDAYRPKWHLDTYFNNYRGIGFGVTPTPIRLLGNSVKKDKERSFIVGLQFSFDSQTGMGANLNARFGINSIANEHASERNFGMFGAGIGWNSQQGLTSLRFNRYHDVDVSFASSSYFPGHTFNMKGFNTSAGYTLTHKDSLGELNKAFKIDGRYIQNRLDEKEKVMTAYGTLYSQNSEVAENSNMDANYLQDVNIYNDVSVTKRSKNMGVPVGTSDIYSISGQGIGGSFSAHRNDIGRFHPSQSTTENISIPSAFEVGVGQDARNPTATDFHIGADVGTTLGGAWSYSGKLKKGNQQISNLDFDGKQNSAPRYEPVYFKIIGEMTAVPKNQWDYMNNLDTTAFEMGLKMFEGGIAPTPSFKNRVVGEVGASPHISNSGYEKDRIKKMQNVQYKTKEDITTDELYAERGKHLFYDGEMPSSESVTGSAIDYKETGDLGTNDGLSHIHEYEILQADGSKYYYGLPAYNTTQNTHVFANTSAADIPTEYNDGDLVSYDEDDASIENDEGIDHYYSGNELPAYVHAHLLTQITSADYVDVTGNGATEDDLGYYTKFNYHNAIEYNWREPFYNADYIKGYYSNESDDKATFTYGEKELYYVHSIETKTHIAVFELGDRADGVGVSLEHQKETPDSSAFGANQKYLKTIKLYSKADILEEGGVSFTEPLQIVHLKYNYELCQGVLNHDTSVSIDSDHFVSPVEPTDDYGKLTLKEVSISYNGNGKGRLSPYLFDYTSNQDYSRLKMDRWGNYQESEDVNEHEVNPYTRQDLSEEDRIKNASAWCLSEINLPSGGSVNVRYEADDYGYVQDVRAAEMVNILGFTDSETTESPDDYYEKYKFSKKKLRLWFEADALEGEEGDDRDAVIADYIKDLDQIYFKVFTELKRPEGETEYAKDYVVGYAEIAIEKPDYYGADDDENYGYVDLVAEEYRSVGLELFKTHPMRKAAWQYLRYSRTDLFNNLSDLSHTDFEEEFWSSFDMLFDSVEEAMAMLALGQYNRYAIWNYCKRFSGNKDSFIRLNSPNKHKYGGGHRVQGIYLSDNWSDEDGGRTFGTTYTYENENGSTSGVADYEPIVGGEENALKSPKWYNPNDQIINFQHQDLFLETPLMEALYPAPRIVYRRIEERRTGHFPEDLFEGFSTEDSEVGITVTEHFTAKEFPVFESHTKLNHKGYNVPLFIPFVGSMSYNNNGFSQGYKLELNDMSGRLKSIALYPFGSNFELDEPIAKTEYKYKSVEVSRRGERRLENNVKVLDGHGEIREALIGVQMDFTVYEEENSSYTESIIAETNIDILSDPSKPIFIPVPTVWPKINHSQFVYRGLSTSKVIYRTGILEEVVITTDGSAVSTRNELYDAETGQALLTTVNNEWDKPVYNYQYAAHWNYEQMGGAYENYGAKVFIEGTSDALYLAESDDEAIIPYQDVLKVGDEITVEESGVLLTYYVSEFISADYFKLEDRDGTSIGFGPSGKEGVITRSGNRNLQAVKSGSIVALSDNFLQVHGGLSPFALAWNNSITGADPQKGEDYILPGFDTYENLNSGASELYDWHAEKIFLPNIYDCELDSFANFYTDINFDLFTNDEIRITSESAVEYWFEFAFIGTSPMDEGYISESILDGPTSSYTEQLVDFKIISETYDLAGNVETVTFLHIPFGEEFVANVNTHGVSLTRCELKNILHADAVEFSDDWTYPYADVGNPEVELGTNISSLGINAYRYGKKGIWRAKKTYLYQTDRQQSGPITQTRNNIDGEYEPWEPYSWLDGSLNPKWDWVSEITRYNPYGFGLEEKSRLSYIEEDGSPGVYNESAIFSSQLYGYHNSVVIATSALANYYEVGFNGFEQEYSTALINSGHIDLDAEVVDISNLKAHTGDHSLLLANGEEVSFTSEFFAVDGGGELIEDDGAGLQGIVGKEYVVSLWVNVEEEDAYGELIIDGVILSTVESREVIDGWKKLELKFTMPSADLEIKYISSGKTYIDDIRIGPYEGGMMTYVYDRSNLWLVAELDGLNYATFYNYDSEGNLVQVKKETEKGIVTVSTARSNTLQQLP